MEKYLERYEQWLHSRKIDQATRNELKAMKDDPDEIKMRFSGYMEFGTGGLRAKMGAGSAMMNLYTVAHATEGVARALLDIIPDTKKRGVIIDYDSRNNSYAFALRAAEVISAHGIKVYLFDELRPTPMLSAGVRLLHCAGGINITASHNPAAYNGYKFYWEDGAQPTSNIADKVSEYIRNVDIFKDVPSKSKARMSLVTHLGRDFDEIFIEKVLAERVYPEIVKKAADKLNVVYTPLYGCGYRMVPETLKRMGVKHLHILRSQSKPNGDFPGLPKPNPEYPQTFTEAIKLAKRVDSDIIIANDPDCDRIGVMARGSDGQYHCITGNQMGCLLMDYIFTALEEQGKMPSDAYAIKTIVSSEMVTEICRQHKVELSNVLTGFKYIAEVVAQHEAKGSGTFMLGYEESYGYMKGNYSRDKDGVVAAMLICEMAAFYELKNKTLIDALDGLYKKYGYFTEYSAEIYMEGLDGKEKIASMMDSIRSSYPDSIGGSKIVNVRDYLKQTSYDVLTGKTTSTGLPESNVLYLKAENGCVVVARPSGTEPKIKFYILANGKTRKAADANSKACTNSLEDILGLEHGSLKK